MSRHRRGNGKSRDDKPPSKQIKDGVVEEEEYDLKNEKHLHSPSRRTLSRKHHHRSSRHLSSSSKSSGDRRRKEDGSSSRPSYSRSKSESVTSRRHHSTDSPSKSSKRSSSERLSSDNKRWDSRSPRSSSKHSRKHSSRKLEATSVALDENEEVPKSPHRQSREKVHAMTPGVEHISSQSSWLMNTLYGKDSDTNSRSTGASSDNKANKSLNTLYGSDADAKLKAKASEPARTPGVDRVFTPSSSPTLQKAKISRGSLDQKLSPASNTSSTKNSTTISTLYGDDDADTKAKAKASRGSNEPVSNPGVESVFASSRSHSTVSTLYGSDADSKAKARASRGSSISPNTGSAAGTLYGNDADAKAKARLGSSALAANPGVVNVAHRLTMAPLTDDDSSVSVTSNTDELYDTEVDNPVARRVSIGSTDPDSASMSEPQRRSDAGANEAMDGFRMPNEAGTKSRKRKRSKKKKEVEDTRKKSRRKCIVLWLFLLLFLGSGGAAAYWYFLIRNKGSGGDGSSDNANIQDRAKSPSSPTATSLSPSESPTAAGTTWFPSSPPSRGLTYERPSDSDCQAMALNQTIPGRETMEKVDFELGVEVVLSEYATLTEKHLQELLGAIQKKILPSLAGCSVDIDEMVEAWRFVIFDAFVTGSVPPDESCVNEDLMELNCHRVSVYLDLFLKGNMRFLDIIGLISAEEENISSHLGLYHPFIIVKLIGAKSLIPTDAPTRMPSDAPSFSPTDFPTVQASSNPTNVPSVLPTRAPTEEPSPSPTVVPSAAPSMVPSTSSPTAVPSVRPSMALSESPSVRPTIMLTGSPTQVPTPAPSASPTVSPAPTRIPSMKPTATPSAVPSRSPTTTPSAEPTITSFHWVTCGRLNGCGGPATVQNSNFAKISGTGKEIAVRCCSDTWLSGFKKKCSAAWAVSYLDGVCYNSVTHHEATALCSGLGARLCTQVELNSNCAKGTGCNHDKRWIWTSTPSP